MNPIKRITAALIAAAMMATALVSASTTPAAAAPQWYCLSYSGLSLAADGYLDIAGMANWEWDYRYRAYNLCRTGGWLSGTVYEDGTYNNWGWWGCVPDAFCNA